MNKYLLKFLLLLLIPQGLIFAQDLAKETPSWLKDGITDSGASHEPWMFLIRRNSPDFNTWQKDAYDYMLSEEYIKSLADEGINLYHIFCYKGYGFEAEKDHMRKAAKAAVIAHKYGMKVNTYVQWNTMIYETFFNEVPEAKTEKWYQMDVSGNPIMLHYGYQQSFRFRPCYNHKEYMKYYKEKILSYVVDSVKADFIHFDNFVMAHPAEADHNPATRAAFREYLYSKFDTKEKRLERFGIENLSQILPPMWNRSNPAEKIVKINDPVIQEWIDFRCWSQGEHIAECARYVRSKNKDIAIELNPHGLTGYNILWELAVNHPYLAQYTNAFVTEEPNHIKFEDGVSTGKFRTYKMGRTTGNTIFTDHHTENALAECLALNRAVGSYNMPMEEPASRKYLTFWNANKDIYLGAEGQEKVAVLRAYSSMAYNTYATHSSVNMAEQALQQSQIPFDIIFDEQFDEIGKYKAIVLANQESLADSTIENLKNFVKNGGGLVLTGNTGEFDNWRRLRKDNGFSDLFNTDSYNKHERSTAAYGKGMLIYIPELINPSTELVSNEIEQELGFATKWRKPANLNEFTSAVRWAAGEKLPLTVNAPEWIGVSHDKNGKYDMVHLFSYRPGTKTVGISLEINGTVKSVELISPDLPVKKTISFQQSKGSCFIEIPELDVYQVLKIER